MLGPSEKWICKMAMSFFEETMVGSSAKSISFRPGQWTHKCERPGGSARQKET
jgi:hypothetical protein